MFAIHRRQRAFGAPARLQGRGRVAEGVERERLRDPGVETVRVGCVLFVAEREGGVRVGEGGVRFAGREMRVRQAYFGDLHVDPRADALPVRARGDRRGLHQLRAGEVAARRLLEFDGQVVAGHRERAGGGVVGRRIVDREREGFLEQGHRLGRAPPAGEGRGRRRQHAYAGGRGVMFRGSGGGEFPLGRVALARSQVEGRLRQVELAAAGIVGAVAPVPAERVEERGALVPAAEVLAADVRGQDAEGRQLSAASSTRAAASRQRAKTASGCAAWSFQPAFRQVSKSVIASTPA